MKDVTLTLRFDITTEELTEEAIKKHAVSVLMNADPDILAEDLRIEGIV